MKKLIQPILNFVKEYPLLTFVLVALVLSLSTYFTSVKYIAVWTLGISSLIAVLPLSWDMINTLRNGQFGIDILAATAIVSSVLLGQYWAAIVIVLMLTGGEALENYAENRAKTELHSLLQHRPKLAHLIKSKETIQIKVKDIKVGDSLSILPGETIPVDCVIIDGTTSVDESSLTGESLPITKNVGDELLSGTINIDGSIKVKAIRAEKESQYEQIIKLVEAASSTESPFVRLADRYSIPFTLVAFLIAGIVWYISGHAIRFLDVIVVATPCPLLLAAPIALISGMSRSAKYGIIVKNGSTLEKLAELKAIGFDKTGTLTKGRPVVKTIDTYNSYKKSDLLLFAAAMEQNSNHVLAQAIVNKANESKLKIPSAKHVKEVSGKGLSGSVKGHDVLIGRLSLLLDNDIALPKTFYSKKINDIATYIAIDSKLAGVITFTDELRAESKELLDRVKNAGIKHVIMVTGDHKAAAQQIAKKLGITEFTYEALPAEKIKAIEEAGKHPIAFVGDGVNDAPVLTVADVGIALGAKGSTAASESADVVIMLDDVSKVASAIEIAKRTFSIARQSILIGIFISVLLMVTFATGKFPPLLGALLQEVVDVVVIFNALRAHSIWQEKFADNKQTSL